MNQIQEMLAQSGVQATQAEIEALINEVGANPENLSETEVEAIAEELITRKKNSALAIGKSKGGKPAKQPKGRKQVKDLNVNDALSHVAKVSSAEITTFFDVVSAGAEQFEDVQSDQLIDRLRSVPTNIVTKFTEKAMGESADVDSFREIGQQFSDSIFGSFATTTAE